MGEDISTQVNGDILNKMIIFVVIHYCGMPDYALNKRLFRQWYESRPEKGQNEHNVGFFFQF